MTFARNLHGPCKRLTCRILRVRWGGQGAFAALDLPKHQRKDAADADKILPFYALWGKP